jgi:hypothetical protein
MRTLVIVGSGAIGLGVIVLGACSAPYAYAPGYCDPNADFPEEDCLKKFADAGADAETSDDMIQRGTAPCFGGDCAQEPKGEFAGNWEKVPVTLWVGPDGPTPLACPESAPTEVYRLFDDLVAPSAACEACTCEASKGDCTKPPPTIEIRAGMCGEAGVPAVNFSGPANWDGSCTNVYGMPKGTMCGNEPCAQSVWASPLDAPTNDACAAAKKIPSSTKEQSWKTRAIACQATTQNGACGSENSFCVAKPGPEWLSCVYQKGVHALNVCPNNYRDSVRTLYPYEPIDDRSCTECACGAPSGSACIGNMRLYDDASCSVEVVNLLVGSMSENCTGVVPAGLGLGSKRVSNLSYLSGTCEASGGEAVGSAVVDAQRAVTFCCGRPEQYEIE